MNRGEFVLIPKYAVEDLGLSGNELLIYSIVFNFSKDGKSYFRGTAKYFMEWTGAADSTVRDCVNRLISKGLISKHPDPSKPGRVMLKVTPPEIGDPPESGAAGNRRPTRRKSAHTPPESGGPSERNIKNKKGKGGSAENADLFPDTNPSKKTLFRNSSANSLELIQKKLGGAEFSEVDLSYYFGAVKDWSDMKSVKRTSQGWISTIRDWIRKDVKAGKLVSLTGEKDEAITDDYLKI